MKGVLKIMEIKKLVKKFIMNDKENFLLFLLSSLMVSGICILLPWQIKIIINLAENRNFFQTESYLQIFLLFFSLFSLYYLYRLMIIKSNKFIQSNIKTLRKNILKNAIENTSITYKNFTSAHLAHHIIYDMNGLETHLINLLTYIFFDIFIVVGILFVMFNINKYIFYVELIFLIVTIYFIHFLGKPLFAHNQTLLKNLQKLNTKLQDIILGLTIIKIFNLKRKKFKAIKKINQHLYEQNIRLIKAEAVIIPFKYFLEIMGIILIVIITAYLIQINILSASYLIALMMYAEILAEPASHLSGYIISIQKVRNYLSRLERILPEKNQPITPLFSDQKTINHVQEITFEQVCFKYPLSNKKIIHNISLSAKKGEVIRINGKNGSGKSTLMELLMGFLKPDSGVIKVNSEDLFSLEEENWRYLISMMPQKAYFFEETLEYNLTFSNPKISPEKLHEIIQILELQPLIDNLPNGIHTILKTKKINFSGGEEQKLSLARILLIDPEVIILDEPFNHLDVKTSEILKSVLNMILPNKIIFIIEHDESYISNFVTQTIHLF